MIPLAVLPVLLSLASYRGAPWLARRCSPSWAARSLVVLGLICAVASGLVLCAVACLGLAELPRLARTGHWSASTLAQQITVPLPVALVAAVVAGVLIATSTRQVLRTVRRLVSVGRTARAFGAGHRGPGVGGLVIVDDDSTGAFAIPGLVRWRGRTVVSRRLLRALDPTERRALLAHEDSHLRHRHFLYVQLMELAAAANPLLRPSVHAVRCAVEQWADDDAVAVVGDAVPVARALAKAALHRAALPRTAIPDFALSAAETEIAGRVRNLLQPSGRGTPIAVAVMAGLAIVCAVSSVTVALHAHQDFEQAQARYLSSRSVT